MRPPQLVYIAIAMSHTTLCVIVGHCAEHNVHVQSRSLPVLLSLLLLVSSSSTSFTSFTPFSSFGPSQHFSHIIFTPSMLIESKKCNANVTCQINGKVGFSALYLLLAEVLADWSRAAPLTARRLRPVPASRFRVPKPPHHHPITNHTPSCNAALHHSVMQLVPLTS